MSQDDITLLMIALVVILGIVAAIAKFRMHPFPALMIGALVLGLWTGADPAAIIKSFQTGFGGTLASVGVLLALGAMFGELLASSGGAERVSSALVNAGGTRLVPWTIGFVAMLLGLPLFFEAAVVLMMPIVLTVGAQLAKEPGGLKGNPYLLAGLPVFAGIGVMHVLVPPHPGPMVAIDAIGADLGATLLIGILLAFPVAIVAGPLFTYWIAPRATANPPADLVARLTRRDDRFRAPGIGVTVMTILFPILLMMGKAATDLLLQVGHPVHTLFVFIGHPIVALLLAVLLGMCTFGLFLGKDTRLIGKLLGDALPPMAAIMLIIGAGGALKQLLIDVGLGRTIANASQLVELSPLLLGWFTAVIIRLATGSATVATVTAGGLMAATISVNPDLNPALLVLAIGAGSMFFSHVNDAGFWMVKELMGMSVPDVFKTWTMVSNIISVTGLLFVLALSLVI